MKKQALVFVFIAVACLVLGLAAWRFFPRWFGSHSGNAAMPAPRAMMFDEDTPRPIHPSVALQVNEGAEATVFAGTPLWLTVGVNNAAAANEIAAAQALSGRLARMPANAPGREALRSNYERRRAPASIQLGDASHPWTAALQFVVRDAQGGERPFGVPLKLLGAEPGMAQLDAVASVQAIFGTASANAPAGKYSLIACLGATGSWQGRTCSEPVTLTAQYRPPALTTEEEEAVTRQGGRFGLLAGDPQLLNEAGRKMVAADRGSVTGHLYLGEAGFLEGKWSEAIQEFTTARRERSRSYPNALEPPLFLNARINQALARLSR